MKNLSHSASFHCGLNNAPSNAGTKHLADAFADSQRRIAYERLLLDLIEGDPTLFVRRDEVEAQWRWIDRIRDGWAHAEMESKLHVAEPSGPAAAIAPTERDGASWDD